MTVTLASPAKITSAERKKLEIKCHNRLNWSDSGNWMGVGKQPNCFIKENLKSYSSHTFKFPTDASATNWNLEWEKAIRYSGHLGTTVLTVGVTVFTGGMAGIAIGSLAAIIKDELQAQIPYPRVNRGWSYEVIFKYDFKWSPHPWGQRELVQTMVTITKDHNQKEVSATSSERKYKLSELPDGLGRMLASAPSKITSTDFL